MSPVVIIFMLTLGRGQGGEHALGHAGVRPHAGADDRHLADFFLVLDLGPQLGGQRPQHGQRGRQLVLEHGEADGGLARGADVLRDHVHDDVLLGDGRKDAMADAGLDRARRSG